MGSNPTNKSKSGVFTSIGTPARRAHNPKPDAERPMSPEQAEQPGHVPVGSRYEPGREQAASGRRGRVIGVGLSDAARSRALANQAAHHASRPLAHTRALGIDVDAAPSRRPLPQEEITRRLVREASPVVVARSPLHDELTLSGAQRRAPLTKISFDDVDEPGHDQVPLLATDVGATSGGGTSSTVSVDAAASALGSQQIAREQYARGLDDLATELTVTPDHQDLAPNINLVFRVFHELRLSGIGQLALMPNLLFQSPEEVRNSLRAFVVARAHESLSQPLAKLFDQRVGGVLSSAEFLAAAVSVPSLKPLLTGMRQVSSADLSFEQPDLRRDEVIIQLLELYRAVWHDKTEIDANLVIKSLSALGLQNFEPDFAMLFIDLVHAPLQEKKEAVSIFIKSRLESHLSVPLFGRFVVLMTRAPDYLGIWEEASRAYDEPVWAVSASSSAGSMAGGQGHSRQQKEAEDENPAT
jgi:hypothetical protein